MTKPLFVRVKDKSTGHEFDVRSDSLLLTEGSVEPVKADRFPESHTLRAPKHHLKPAGRSATRTAAPSSEAPKTATPKEN